MHEPPARFARRPIAWLVLVAALVLVPTGSSQGPADAEAEGPRAYTVLLEAPSVGARLRETQGKDATAIPRREASSVGLLRRAVAQAQEPLVDSIEALGVEVVGSVRNVLNAVFIRATPEEAEAVGALPGVRGVVPSRRYEPTLTSVADIVKVAAAHQRPGGSPVLGDGLKIGILDSGLEFDHPAFQDDGLRLLPGYPKADPGFLGLTSAKVIVARSYVERMNDKSVGGSSPDDYSPWDRAGHGTAVAMIAAGNAVESPAGAISGIAPKARIGVYKVFGTPGINFHTADQVVISAIDDAVEDGMDILNLSLGHVSLWPWDAAGSDCRLARSTSLCDPLAVAAQNAVEEFGRVVVVAAGNEGRRGLDADPLLVSINSPANAPAVITVGGVGNAYESRETVRLGDQAFEAYSGTGPAADGVLTAPAAVAADYGDYRGCAPFPAGSLTGRIAVIRRGVCLFRDKVEHADAAGAVGVLVMNQWEDDEDDGGLVRMALLEDTDIPAFFVNRADGDSILSQVTVAGGILALDPTPVQAESDWNQVTSSSSRGPTVALLPKPDLAAPSSVLYSAAPRYNAEGNLYSPSGFRSTSGTSFAAPSVSGAAALVWEAFPTLSARQVGSALINSASPSVMEDDEPARLSSVGAGVLDVEAALRPGAVAVPPSVAFGAVAFNRFPLSREITITNRSRTRQSFRLSVEPRDADSFARVSVDGRQFRTLTLGGGASQSFSVRLDGSQPLPGSYEGFLRLESTSGNGAVRIPYLYFVGDNRPSNAFRVRGRNDIGAEGEEADRSVAARVIDQYGVPVVNHSVTFSAGSGSPRIQSSSSVSGPTGLINANVRYSAEEETQSVVARIGDLELRFSYEATGTFPEIRAIHNAASGSSPEGIAPGSLVTISGFGFAVHPSGPASDRQASQLPIMRKGTSVAFDSPFQEDFSFAGRILSIGPDFVTLQVPWGLDQKSDSFVKVRSGAFSEPFRVDLAREDPGIYTHDCKGVEIASAMLPDGSPVSLDEPAPAGATITILMTGNGPVRSPPPAGESSSLAVPTVSRPTVRIAGQEAPVTFSGLVPDMAGLYMVSATVPASTPSGIHPLRVRFNARDSNVALLPVE